MEGKDKAAEWSVVLASRPARQEQSNNVKTTPLAATQGGPSRTRTAAAGTEAAVAGTRPAEEARRPARALQEVKPPDDQGNQQWRTKQREE